MKYAEDCSYHEIAERLGIGHSAVEARLHRARSRLRSALAPMFADSRSNTSAVS
jgi:DNA-directed RNA polymerase specialized sigma24 family protein